MPSVAHREWKDVSKQFKTWVSDFDNCHVTPEQLRWFPMKHETGMFHE